MPRGDGTGPMGYGPMTGRGAGFCAGYDRPGFMHPGPGRFFVGGRGGGMGGGRGRGWRRGFGPAYPAGPLPMSEPDADEERQALRHQADALKAQLGRIEQRLSELEDASST